MTGSCFFCGHFVGPGQRERFKVMLSQGLLPESLTSFCNLFQLSEPRAYSDLLGSSRFCDPCVTSVLDLHTTMKMVQSLEGRLSQVKEDLRNKIGVMMVRVNSTNTAAETGGGGSCSVSHPELADSFYQEILKDGGPWTSMDLEDLGSVEDSLDDDVKEEILGGFELITIMDEDDIDQFNYTVVEIDGPTEGQSTSPVPMTRLRPKRKCPTESSSGNMIETNRSPKRTNSAKSRADEPMTSAQEEPKRRYITRFSCDLCDFCAVTIRDLKSHISILHPDLTSSHKCQHCPKTFVAKDILRKHVFRVHFSEPKFKCQICFRSQGLQSREALKEHEKFHEDSQNPFTCSTCSQVFKNSSSLRVHVVAHENPFKCQHESCSKTFRTETELNKHIPRHKRSIVCNLCGAWFHDHLKLKSHIAHKHSTDRPFKCDSCPGTYKTQECLKQHEERCHPKEHRFSCSLCPKLFTNSADLKHHEEWHAAGASAKKYSCDTCQQLFATEGGLKSHNLVHGKTSASKGTARWPARDKIIPTDKPKDVRQQRQSKPKPTKLNRVYHRKSKPKPVLPVPEFRCNVCYKSAGIDSAESLSEHEKFHLEIPNPFTCSTCSQEFSSTARLRRHVATHENPFVCPKETCPKSFRTQEEVTKHAAWHSELNFACETCGKGFHTRSGLSNHCAVKHATGKPYMCDQCARTFKFKPQLQEHIQRVHLKTRQFICAICSASWVTPGALQRHEERVHSGRKNYSCKGCGKKFVTQCTVSQHQINHCPLLPRPQNSLQIMRKRIRKKKSRGIEVSPISDPSVSNELQAENTVNVQEMKYFVV